MPLEEKINPVGYESLSDRVNADIKTAMLALLDKNQNPTGRAKDQQKLEAIRGIKAQLLLLKTSGQKITEEEEIKTLQKMVKQRKESAEIYQQQNRKDLADVELLQISVIEQYLPKQMSEEEIKSSVTQIISQVGATSPADMGKVMGAAMKQLAGKADGKIISVMVKQLLAKD